MRIIVNAMHLSDRRTGLGVYTASILEALSKVDFENNYLILYGATRLSSLQALNNLDPGQIEFPGAFGSVSRHLRTLRYRWFPPQFVVGTAQPDIYHEMNYVPILNGRRVITNIYDMSFRLCPEHLPRRRVLWLQVNSRRMRSADHILTISSSSKGEIQDLLGVPEDRITVAYPGIRSIFRPAESASNHPASINGWRLQKPFVLYVGTIEPRKNIDLLIRAFSFVRQKVSSDLTLVLVGKKGWLYGSLFRLIDELRLGDCVKWLGYVREEDLPTLYQAASAFCYPSHYEGFGIPVVEAMACGCPVVASNRSSLPEVVGDAGIMINPSNLDELVYALSRVLTDSDLRLEMQKKGIKRATVFTWRRTAEQVLSMYEKVNTS